MGLCCYSRVFLCACVEFGCQSYVFMLCVCIYIFFKMECFDEKLIEIVRENRPLYDLRNRDYKNINKKEHIWRQIGEKLNCNPEKCKKRWKGLRDTYKRNKKSSVLPSGSGAPEESIKWKYYNQLTFLNDCEGYRRTVCNDSPNNFECSMENIETYMIDDDVFGELSPSPVLSSTTPVAVTTASRSASISTASSSRTTSAEGPSGTASSSRTTSTEGPSGTASSSRTASTEGPSQNNRKKNNPLVSAEFKEFLSSASEAIKTISGTNASNTSIRMKMNR